MTPRERAIEFLCQGVSTLQTAKALGVDPSYISQLRQEPDIAEKIAAAEAAVTKQDLDHDRLLNEAEDLALQRIHANMKFANLGQALAAFKVLNGAVRRNDKPDAPQSNVTNIQVNLTLPAAALPSYVMNQRNEIVEVEGKTMVSTTPRNLDELLAQREALRIASLPQITPTQKAAEILDGLNALPVRTNLSKPRRLPSDISADML